MNKTRSTVLVGMILAAAASRLIPHVPNFTPVPAIALFGGAQFSSKRLAFLVPLAGLFLSDLVIGFFSISPVVYGSFALTVCIGFWMRRRHSAQRVAFAALLSAILFFVVTNFGMWEIYNFYPKTQAGLAECYIAAIPYFRNMLLGDLFYSALLFSGFALAEDRFPGLSEPQLNAA